MKPPVETEFPLLMMEMVVEKGDPGQRPVLRITATPRDGLQDWSLTRMKPHVEI
jgi:hypothetical protein